MMSHSILAPTTAQEGAGEPWDPLAGTELSADDDATADHFLSPSATTQTLTGTGCDFSAVVRLGSLIKGVRVDIEHQSDNTIVSKSVQLYVGGTASGASKTDTIDINGPDIVQGYGSPGDLWGASISLSDLSDLGAGIRYTAGAAPSTRLAVDYMMITLYWYPPGHRSRCNLRTRRR